MENLQMFEDADFDVDYNLTCRIFSILENNFLFGDSPSKQQYGKVRILSIDGAGVTDGILAAKALCVLESSIRVKSGDPYARIADYFDVAAGPGAGGILAALLFARGADGRPLSTADEALGFLVRNRRRRKRSASSAIGRLLFGSSSCSSSKALKKAFGKLTLKDTLKAVLIPCYDLATRAPFVFSRADAVESDGYDFKLSQVCSAALADPENAVEMRSSDEKTKIAASGGGSAVNNNPTAVAIAHVLNNKQEFPLCRGVEDLLVVSLGNGECTTSSPSHTATTTTSDLVDEAVSMAFGECRSTDYVRIQANCTSFPSKSDGKKMIRVADDMMKQKSVESVLFKGKKSEDNTNEEKLHLFAGDLIKEHQRRKIANQPNVLLKRTLGTSPRFSSATTQSTFSSN